ncbi:MAG: DUF2452 domain-containing protein, partial [Aliifodinibius sp.]|nr:DUF2452 domain-containing protein [candidate division Zixibacteria bacterium]NIT56552.1 DUF2452 domain-containing protein [Fodinibius sp.]NIU13700.1 DUF2452 domain-containing protein [candidate division Zixibacteria bacterium]NIV08155.1 DUF2452 domain-containing protein [candidate division Zixibacteria bacterium]NIY25135.1 DUF2452 domain-containing protein [Fodinibius sp.]
MTEKNTTKYTGKNHLRPAHSSPYPTSRLAPQIELVDIAKQISHADSMIGHQTNAKLKLIADQIKSLQ